MRMLHLVIGAAALAVLAGIYIVMSLSRFRESAGAMEQTAREVLMRLQKAEECIGDAEQRIEDGFASMRKEQREAALDARSEQSRAIETFGDAQAKRIKDIGDAQRDNFTAFARQISGIGDAQSALVKEMSENQSESLAAFSQQLTNISRLNEEKLEALRSSVDQRMLELRKSSEERLEKMRATVDEQLHSTLEKRLGEAFSTVSERLELVHKGLGEMRALTADVGDLRKVLSNVKTRGIWGEMQLQALLQQMLTKEQYAENIATRLGSAERVEFAVILPGANGTGSIYLPIDSKFPLEDYSRIVSASEGNDASAVNEARKALQIRILDEAKDIHNKYVEPPYTTDFGILYLPVEGLYAEVLRIDGLCERMSRDYRVVPAGPVTICALLNSLQMGFRTLAIEKRSSEVWELLGKVKTEFEKFGDILDKTRKKMNEAAKELDRAGNRTKAINRALKKVQQLPSGEDISDDDESLTKEYE